MELAKWVVAFVAASLYLAVIVDGFIPATALQHVRNPKWPPHAKFHNGQSMLMGAGLGTLALAMVFGARPLTFPVLLCAAFVSAMYYIAMELAPLFPGTGWYDPEFKDAFPNVLGMHPQQLLGYVMLGVTFAGVLYAWFDRTA